MDYDILKARYDEIKSNYYLVCDMYNRLKRESKKKDNMISKQEYVIQDLNEENNSLKKENEFLKASLHFLEGIEIC